MPRRSPDRTRRAGAQPISATAPLPRHDRRARAPRRLRPGVHAGAQPGHRPGRVPLADGLPESVLASELSPVLLRRHFPLVAELLSELAALVAPPPPSAKH